MPTPLAGVLLLVTFAATATFIARGIGEAAVGETRLAGRLLDVRERDHSPYAFELSDPKGGKLSVDQLKGKIVLLNFWATWCPPCIEEMPSMIRLFEKLRSDPRFELLAVSTDESWEPVNRFFEGATPAFKVLLDPGGVLAKKYGTTMFPETYVIIDGRVRGFIEGPRNWDSWYAEAFFRGLLAERG